MLKTGITNTIREMCSCNFTSSDMEESEVSCSAGDNTTLTFTTTVVYLTESGDMTASASASTMISVGSQTATIVSVCSPYCIPDPQSSPMSTSPSPTSTPELQEVMEPLTSNAATLTGAFIGGLVTGMIILIITAIIVR